jgi:hypothetical protein
MSSIVRFNRFLQFAYPTFVFVSFLLVWNSVVQLNGFADSQMPGLEPNPSSISSAQIQNSCSAQQLTSPEAEARSCAEESSQPWRLVGSHELSGDSVAQGGTAGSSQQLTDPI